MHQGLANDIKIYTTAGLLNNLQPHYLMPEYKIPGKLRKIGCLLSTNLYKNTVPIQCLRLECKSSLSLMPSATAILWLWPLRHLRSPLRTAYTSTLLNWWWDAHSVMVIPLRLNSARTSRTVRAIDSSSNCLILINFVQLYAIFNPLIKHYFV